MKKFASKTSVAVVGLGYVGLPTALAIAEAGVKVTGIDINKKRVNQLNGGKSFIAEIPDETVKRMLKNFRATTDWKAIKKCNVVLITVPTPLNKNKAPDTSFIENAAKKIYPHIKRGVIVVLESTTYPGTTEELLLPILERSGLKAGRDFYLAFAPERIDPGNKQFKFTDIPKVVGGINKISTDKTAAFYQLYLKKVHPVSSARTAEMTKLLENIFRLVNISLVNELKMLADKMDIDFWEVIEAAKTKPYGFTPFYPGPGVGGHCIPLDPFYLSWKARELNFFTRFIDLAGEINELMPHHVATKVIWALNNKKKAVRGAKILALGVAYKKDIDDPRESPAVEVIKDLVKKGANVRYNDPFIPQINVSGKTFRSVPLNKKALKSADCVLVLTDHSIYDYKMIARTAKLIIDTRGAIKARKPSIIT
ncbi:MAG: Nucleotide sugar dehydrogenase [Candidatus Jorgensenbacteria bacterium GW2011_GWC1_48_8]|uniref:Nucleotide sugar dehydrogenase n=1 Tax=Candidatus Jorgensenbacteria bacterium GW2011_GWC1_48_8 TaxID=1618666 RepID=A0A0G1UWY3_9BACT|nr:MAG: Nucleotide sugar dehydrogenase [Parcubacteria group bacterium GW2011_GWB1_45_10]KKU98749.1 MAG: Nucleotide sugar dehydrogenase [Candidatus Jorgensenbacteria bacterium GW2011_GWC1_48_8]